jgi:hypothetical protein
MLTIEVSKVEMLDGGCPSSQLYELLKPRMLAEGMDVDKPAKMEFDHEKHTMRWSQRGPKAAAPEEEEEEEEEEVEEEPEEEEEETVVPDAPLRRRRGGRRR